MGTVAQPNFDPIISTTLQKYNDTAVPQIYKNSYVWYFLKEQKRIKPWSGGRSIVETLLSKENTTIKMIREYENYDMTPQAGITSAEFYAKQMVGVVAISGIEEALNSGKEAVIDLLDTKMTQLDESYMNRLSEYQFQDGSLNGNRHFNGFDIMVKQGTTYGVYGTIDSDAADGSGDFWQNKYYAVGDTFANKAVATLKTMYNTAKKGGRDGLDVFITNQTFYEAYETIAAAFAKFEMIQPRYNQKIADLGFANLLYKDVPIMYDEFINDNLTDGAGTATGQVSVLGLSLKHIAFRALANRNMKLTSFVTPANQDARFAARLFYGNFTCDYRNIQQRALFTG